MRYECKCDWCGKQLMLPASRLNRPHHFCSRECMNAARNKTKNPDGYMNFRDLSKQSAHMTAMNLEMNPSRMTPEVREKLSQSRRKAEEDLKTDTYKKRHGRHEHRTIAEQKIGRQLDSAEIVHHVNGNRHDNRPENLIVFANQSEHVEWHRVMGVFDPITGETEGGDAV